MGAYECATKIGEMQNDRSCTSETIKEVQWHKLWNFRRNVQILRKKLWSLQTIFRILRRIYQWKEKHTSQPVQFFNTLANILGDLKI